MELFSMGFASAILSGTQHRRHGYHFVPECLRLQLRHYRRRRRHPPKSENPYGNGEVPVSKNITITNGVVSSASNGFKMGTATLGAFENIVFSNSVIYSDNGSPMMNRVIGGINVETVDGGSVDGVVISNIRMQNVRAPIFVRLGQRNKRRGNIPAQCSHRRRRRGGRNRHQFHHRGAGTSPH